MAQLPLTEFARKYGQIDPTHHRSGFTPDDPIIPYDPNFGPSPFDTWDPRRYQRSELYGFTSEELQRLDCLPTRELRPGNLVNQILPLMQRDAWETGPLPDYDRTYFYPLPDASGNWEAKDFRVWNALVPCLVLASRILTSMDVLPWFGALLRGDRMPIPDERIDRNDQGKNGAGDLYSFHRVADYTDAEIAQTKSERDAMFVKLQNELKLQWGFMDSDQEFPDNLISPGPGAYGLTQDNTGYMQGSNDPARFWRVFIWLDLNMVSPLLRLDINSADKMMLQWTVANTVAHELMHAIEIAHVLPNGGFPLAHEPYFETEAVSEIGASYEAAINHGSNIPFVVDSNLMPMGYFHRRTFPSLKDPETYESEIVLKDPGPSIKDQLFPIPISVYEDMQQEKFWEVHIRKFGHGSLHYRDVGVGAEVTYALSTKAGQPFVKLTRKERLPGFNYGVENQLFRSNVETLEHVVNMTTADLEALKFGKLFVRSSTSEAAFWDGSEQQSKAVTVMTDTIEAIFRKRNMRPQDLNFLTTGLLDAFKTAIENHEVMITAILNAEVTNGIIYPNRRKTLLLWNKGTRTFMNNIMVLQWAAGDLAAKIQDQLTKLERARMILWELNDLTTGLPEDIAEIAIIKLAISQLQQKQNQQCINTCMTLQIYKFQSVTTVTRFLVAMVVFEAASDVYNNWRVRRKIMMDLFKHVDWLLSALPSTLTAWTAHLTLLKGQYIRVMSFPEPPDPNAPPPPPPPKAPNAPAPPKGPTPPNGPAPPTT